MKERDLAMELINEAQRNRAMYGIAYSTVNISEFGEGKYDLDEFKSIVSEMGYKVIPIEESHLRNTHMKNKYVVIGHN